jgi:hypothetical protein
MIMKTVVSNFWRRRDYEDITYRRRQGSEWRDRTNSATKYIFLNWMWVA